MMCVMLTMSYCCFRLVNEKESSHTMTMKKVADRVREMRAKKEIEGSDRGEAAASASADAMCSLAFQVFNSTVGDRADALDFFHLPPL